MDGLGGLVAIVENALDIVMIMGLNDIVKDARSWIKKELPTKLNKKALFFMSLRATSRTCS